MIPNTLEEFRDIKIKYSNAFINFYSYLEEKETYFINDTWMEFVKSEYQRLEILNILNEKEAYFIYNKCNKIREIINKPKDRRYTYSEYDINFCDKDTFIKFMKYYDKMYPIARNEYPGFTITYTNTLICDLWKCEVYNNTREEIIFSDEVRKKIFIDELKQLDKHSEHEEIWNKLMKESIYPMDNTEIEALIVSNKNHSNYYLFMKKKSDPICYPIRVCSDLWINSNKKNKQLSNNIRYINKYYL